MSAPKSKTVATWLAVLAGTVGAHRFYLHGWRDLLGWLHPLPTVLGLIGALRMSNLGVDDRLSWLLVPLLGGMISWAMLSAIVMGLTSDERWAKRFDPQGEPRATGWGPVLGVITALLVGGAVLMGSIAFAGQKFFEVQQEASRPQ